MKHLMPGPYGLSSDGYQYIDFRSFRGVGPFVIFAFRRPALPTVPSSSSIYAPIFFTFVERNNPRAIMAYYSCLIILLLITPQARAPNSSVRYGQVANNAVLGIGGIPTPTRGSDTSLVVNCVV
ncbi:hypothetical protein LX36DRAFT_663362 [Colletotrichum falcatum]|nr:hypothetical protein LX36DRAFT_663362 [Colletotrichum falcatum]